jgi:molecular chaperone HscA
VHAKELRSGTEQRIEVKPQYGLTDAEVERMLMESIQNAKSDMQNRALVEAQTEGKILIDTTLNFIIKNKELLTLEEISASEIQIQNLKEKINAGSKDEVQQAIEHLNNISRPYAERIMDQAVHMAMQGKKI